MQATPEIGKSIPAGDATLVIHGRDDRVIPLSTSEKRLHILDNVQLHVFGRCGHWTQIEHAATFNRPVHDFLME